MDKTVKQFIDYAKVGIVLNIFYIILLWWLIDILHINTIISGIISVGICFILKFVIIKMIKLIK